MNLREAAQQALKALENDVTQRSYAGGVRITNAAVALRAALAEPDEIAAAVAAEREECALVCEALIVDESGVADVTAWQCAAAIRARGET